MSSITEFDYRFSLAADTGVKTHYDGNAANNNIREWLATPMGTVADWPTWGNELYKYQHEPTSVNLAVAIEMHIAKKLPQDVKGIKIKNILIEFNEFDAIVIFINHQYGNFLDTVDR